MGLSAKSVFTLLASPSLSTPTMAEFLKLTKAKGQDIKIGRPGIGTTPHLAAVTFVKATGINPLLVRYSDDCGGDEQCRCRAYLRRFLPGSQHQPLGWTRTRPYILGVYRPQRLKAQLPNTPTFEENGITMTGFERGSWYGVVAPAATPDAIVNKLNAALLDAVSDKDVREKLSASGLELSGSAPGDFGALIKTQYNYWGDTLRAAGVEPEPK